MWYALLAEQNFGPMSANEIMEMYGQGLLTPEVLVWREGMAGWSPIAEVEAFASLFLFDDDDDDDDGATLIMGPDDDILADVLGDEPPPPIAPPPIAPAAPVGPMADMPDALKEQAAQGAPIGYGQARPGSSPGYGFGQPRPSSNPRSTPGFGQPRPSSGPRSTPGFGQPRPSSNPSYGQPVNAQAEPLFAEEDLELIDVLEEVEPAQQPGFIPSQPNFAPQQPGFAPQQPGFAPQQPGFAPQQPGFAPQQPGFAPQQPGFAPQQPGFAPQQPGFAPQQPDFAPQPAAPTPPKQGMSLGAKIGIIFVLLLLGGGVGLGVRMLKAPDTPTPPKIPRPSVVRVTRLDAAPPPLAQDAAPPAPMADGGVATDGGEITDGGVADAAPELEDAAPELEDAASSADPKTPKRVKRPHKRTRPKPEPNKPKLLSREDIQGVLHKSAAKLAACVKDPKLEGRAISVIVRIERSGRISSARLATSGVRGTPTGDCVVDQVKRYQFGEFTGDPMTMTLPLKL